MNSLTLIDELLLEQQSLTVVERFARRHADSEKPLQERYYKDLIPLSRPGDGEQYAFEVDVEACSGCKACVSACHHLNGLSPNESWRDVGVLIGEDDGVPVQQTVTTACHHCLEPACAHGCPTQAYEKDAATGIVRHLDDQCMGCRYCELKCPYQVPKYHESLGIVRKCDMCQFRLAEGEAPACVQACPNEAIRIRVVPRVAPGSEPLVPGVVDSSYTQPLTSFQGVRQSEMRPADVDELRPAEAHWPLVWMLVFVPMSIGSASALWLKTWLGQPVDRGVMVASLMAGIVGLAGSVLHLGRPGKAWKAFLGWRRSWLSREIVVFNFWIVAWMGFAGALWFRWPAPWSWIAGAATTVLGCLGLMASTMVYADTQRLFWKGAHTAWRFGATAFMAGCVVFSVPELALGCLLLLLVWEGRLAFGGDRRLAKPAARLRGPLRATAGFRLATALLGGVGLLTGSAGIALGMGALTLSELAARSLFFRAVDEPKMPGIA